MPCAHQASTPLSELFLNGPSHVNEFQLQPHPMALAVRRLILRSKSFHYRRPTSSATQSQPISLLRIPQRTFQTSASRWKSDDNAKPPQANNAPAAPPKSSRSKKVVKKDAKKDAEVIELSPEEEELNFAAAEEEKRLGRPLTVREQKGLVEDYIQHLVETGETERAVKLMSKDASPAERKQIEATLAKIAELEQKLMGFEELSEAVEKAGDDPTALDPLMEKLDINRQELEAGRAPETLDDRAVIEKLGLQDKGEEEAEQAVWEEYQRLQGLTEEQIAKDRKETQIESMLMDLDPSIRASLENALGNQALKQEIHGPTMNQIVNDKFLFRTIEQEKSLFELWRRLGWETDRSKSGQRDLLTFFRIVQSVDPQTRKMLMKVWDQDRSFGAEFFHTDTVEAREPKEKGRRKPGFWNYEDDEDLGDDESFRNDELPTKGHRELDLKREIREFARWMVWELPLLSSKFSCWLQTIHY